MNLPKFTVSQHENVNELVGEWLSLDGSSGAIASSYPAARAWYEAHKDCGTMQPLILCGRDGVGKCVFILPLMRQLYGPFRVLTRPAMKHLAYYEGLFAPGFASQITGAATNEFWQQLLGQLSGVDAMWIDGVCDTARRSAQPLSRLDYFYSTNPCHKMSLTGDWEAQYVEMTSSKKRSSDRRAMRLVAERGKYSFKLAEKLEDKLSLMTEIFAQKDAQFAETGQYDPFSEDEIQDFYTRLITIDHHSGNPQFSLAGVYLDDQLLSGVLGGKKGDVFHGMIISRISGDLARLSPGRLLLLEMNKYLSSTGVRVHNFGTGKFDYKNSWCDGVMERRHVTFAVNAKGALFIKLLSFATSLKRVIKERRLEHHPVIGKLRTAFGV